MPLTDSKLMSLGAADAATSAAASKPRKVAASGGEKARAPRASHQLDELHRLHVGAPCGEATMPIWVC
jgi:hypothetical protein